MDEKDQELRVDRLAAVGLYSGSLVHEWNNLLMILASHCHELLEQVPAGSAAEQSAQAMLQITEQAGALPRELLGFLRNEKLPVERIGVDGFLAQHGNLWRQAVGRATGFSLDLAAAEAAVVADPAQFRHAVLNLLLNAKSALGPKGHIVLATRPVPGAVQVIVADNGRGMDEETRSQIFEPFFSRRGGGTGLGLSIVKRFVGACGGAQAVHSVLGQGTTVTMQLPLAR